MPKRDANNGSAGVLDESAGDLYPSPSARNTDSRSPRFPRPASDPEAGDGEPFLRARRRVPVRRGLLPGWAKSGWGKGLFAALVLAIAGSLLFATLAVRSFLRHDPRFVIPSAASIQIVGNSQLTRPQLLSVFGSDIGRNLFLIPLAVRRQQLEQIPWVERATVMRVFPNEIRVAVTERTPVAFVLVHGRIQLADAAGVVLDMTPQQMSAKHYSFPVVSGINPEDPLSVRATRMHLYQSFLADLDSSGEHISARLSQVDLSDPEDVRATVPLNGSEVLLYFGQQDFLARWHNFQAHIAEWQQQYPHLASIDLRYEREVVLQRAKTETAPAPNSSDPPAAHHAPALAAHKQAAHRIAPPHRHEVHPAPHKHRT
ncbi:MAG: FtsQ-type POTRA domain-containing protein [Acidobacteriaceae bacterium]